MNTIEINQVSYKIENEVSELILLVSRERDELKELAIWMTGCGYDFCQHDYFIGKREELLKSNSTERNK